MDLTRAELEAGLRLKAEGERLGQWLTTAANEVPGCPWPLPRLLLAISAELAREECRLSLLRLGMFGPLPPTGV